MIGSKAQDLIDNFNFDDAIDFIRDHGDANIADRALRMARSSFTETKLIRELERIVEENPTVEVKINFDVTPQENPDLIEKRNGLVKLRDHLHGQLEIIQSNEDRLKVALKILDISEEIHNVWQDINLANSGVVIQEEKPQDDIDSIFEGANILEIEKIRKNYVTYRSKARKGTRNKDKLPFYESVIREAEKRIANVV